MTRRGVWTFILVLTAIGAAILVAALRLRGSASPASPSTVLVFDVPDELDEAEVPFHPFGLDLFRRNRLTLYRVVHGIRQAAADPHVAGLVLHVDELDWGWARIGEVRDALLAFRDAGKPVYASLTNPSDPEYLLASAASWIAMPPTSVLQLDGLTQTVLFMKGTFDKVDIHPNFSHAGKFKSAVESYTRSEMSPEAREALAALLDDAYDLLVDSLASARGLPDTTIQRILDEGPYVARRARAAGLVDTLAYDAEVDSMAAGDIADDAPLLPFTQYVAHAPESRSGPRIAMITVAGTIASGRSRFEADDGAIAGSETVIDALQDARTRSSIKAVVLRIDSPGGEIGAADDIWREVERLRDVKPVVVSMSDLAASGGYYVAAPADRIVAQPATITGSIGVFGGKLNVLGLYRKLGLNVESLSRGRHAQMMSPYTDFDPDEARLYDAQLADSYRTFLARVAEGRQMSVGAADSIAQGRVWSGWSAWEQGLVDTLGGIETAFRLAAEEAGVSASRGYRVETLPKVERGWMEQLFEEWFPEDQGFPPGIPLPSVLRSWIAAAKIARGANLVLMPYSVQMR